MHLRRISRRGAIHKMPMPAKPKRRNEEYGIPAQLGLFNSSPDPCTVPELRRDADQQISAEQIRERNRIAASQRVCAIKKHRATRLHYDLRLEFEGVLLSWAIPEGPSYRTGERREAIEMEDHNPKYISSERVIPAGKPGAGPLMHWDEGRWAPLPGYEDIGESLRKGCLKFTLYCKKLKGNWMFLRRPGGCRGERRPVWDLIKEPDAFARSADAPNILVEAPNSISTGRTLEEIERDGNQGKGKRASGASLFEIAV